MRRVGGPGEIGEGESLRSYLHPPNGRFDGFLSNLVPTHHLTNNTLESVFGFDVSSLSSTNVPVWKRWECNAENLPDFKVNMKVSYSTL